MRLNIHVTAELELAQETPAFLQVEAVSLPENNQTVEAATLTLTPETPTEAFSDFYGNNCRRLVLPSGDVTVEYTATVAQTDLRLPPLLPEQNDVLRLPPEVILYTLASRYCQSDKLINMAQDEFGQTEPGYPRVQAICAWINKHVTYQYGTSDAATSAFDTATQRQGVCRDFAHLGIAFCRALGIPARYVSGYCLGLQPPDFHAYFQAYLEGQWIAFDATVLDPRPALIQIAIGRDAADCAWSTFYGSGQTKSLNVEVMEASA